MSSLTKFSLWGAGLMMLVVGTLHLINPQMMMNTPMIELSSVNHLHAVRAVYGGGYLGIAALFLLGALGKFESRFALLSVVVVFSGFAAGRLVSIVVDGVPVGMYFGVISAEVFFAVCATMALRQRS